LAPEDVGELVRCAWPASLGEDGAKVAVSGQFDTKFERVKRSCVHMASEMRCPRHFKSAKVEIASENFGNISLEVITCCDEFRRRVERALDRLVQG